MKTSDRLQELSEKLANLQKQKENLEHRKEKASDKGFEIIDEIDNLEKKHNKSRLTALFSSLACAFAITITPLIGLYSLIVAITGLISTIVNSVMMFNLETKIDNVKKKAEICSVLLTSYDEDISCLDSSIKYTEKQINEIVARAKRIPASSIEAALASEINITK